MAHQALKKTLLKKVQQGDELKPGNVWAVTWDREIIQTPKEEFNRNKDKYKDGPFYNWGQASMYKENSLPKTKKDKFGNTLYLAFNREGKPIYVTVPIKEGVMKEETDYSKPLKTKDGEPIYIDDTFYDKYGIKLVVKNDNYHGKVYVFDPKQKDKFFIDSQDLYFVSPKKENKLMKEDISPELVQLARDIRDLKTKKNTLKSQIATMYLYPQDRIEKIQREEKTLQEIEKQIKDKEEKMQSYLKKENKKVLTEAALKQLAMWWEQLPQPDKEKIANSSNRPQMAKTPLDKWQERDLEALITYAGKNNVLFEIATVLRLERANLNDKNRVNSVKENASTFSKKQIKLVNDVSSWCQENDKYLDKQLDRIYSHASDTGYGWESVAKSSPDLFAQALALALQHKNRLKEGTGNEWSSDAEAWIDQAYDQLDDKQYLITGAMRKFNVPKDIAIKIYNKVAMTRDPITYRAGAMFEMANIEDEWDRISKFGRIDLLRSVYKNLGDSAAYNISNKYADKIWSELDKDVQEKIRKYALSKNKNIKEIKKIVKEWMGGMSGIPNINRECEKCGMPANACECQLEDDKKNNDKAELPKGLKFQTDSSTNMTIKKGLKEMKFRDSSDVVADLAKHYKSTDLTYMEIKKFLDKNPKYSRYNNDNEIEHLQMDLQNYVIPETSPSSVKKDILQKIPGSKKTIKIRESQLTKEAKNWLKNKKD